MAGPAPSNERVLRRTLRFAIGVTVPFVLAQLIGWPLAQLAPAFAAVALADASPLSVRTVLRIVGITMAALFGGYFGALFLELHPDRAR